MWPEPYSEKWGAHVQDTLENELKRRVCSKATNPDHITLRDARDAMAANWKNAYLKYVCSR